MDADDVSLPVRLQTQIDFLKQNPSLDVVSSRVSFLEIKSHLRKEFQSNSQEFLLDLQIKTFYSILFVGGCSMVKMKKIIPHKIFFMKNSEVIKNRQFAKTHLS